MRPGARKEDDMATNRDWFPKDRTGQLEMAREWAGVLHARGVSWGVTDAQVSELEDLTEDAGNALAAAKNEATRTPVATANCRVAFEALAAFMRDIKKRHFFEPPLTAGDLAALGLKPHDTVPTQSGVPTAQARAETFLTGPHELGVRIVYVSGSPEDRANKGYRVWHTAYPHGATPPAGPDDLIHSFYTKRKREIIEFNYEDSGKTAYIAVQIENEGKKGPWGPMTSAVVP
jgi:hypothetical protein